MGQQLARLVHIVELIPIGPKESQLVHMAPNMFKCVWIGPNMFKFAK